MHFRFRKYSNWIFSYRTSITTLKLLGCSALHAHDIHIFSLTYFRMNLIWSLKIPFSYSPESDAVLARCMFQFGMQIHALPFAVFTLCFTEETILSRIFIKTISTFSKFELKIHRTSNKCCLPWHNCNVVRNCETTQQFASENSSLN